MYPVQPIPFPKNSPENIIIWHTRVTNKLFQSQSLACMRGSRRTAKSLKECLIMSLIYIVKYALFRIAAPYL